MWLPWNYALILAVGLVVTGRATASSSDRRLTTVSAMATEASIVAVLYAGWQLAGRLSVFRIDGAVAAGQWVWDIERTLWVPSETAFQDAVLPHGWFVQASNLYYGGAHVPGMGIFLVWLFLAHRDRYKPWRNALAWLTGFCLIVQLYPVAPPRLVDGLGIVDTPALYGQSVYSAFGNQIAGQLQAMPSLHVGWALLIGVATVQLGTGAWRWLGPGHAIATAYVVVVTGNHYWLDGVAAGVILVAILVVQRWLARRGQVRALAEELDRPLVTVAAEAPVSMR